MRLNAIFDKTKLKLELQTGFPQQELVGGTIKNPMHFPGAAGAVPYGPAIVHTMDWLSR